MYGVDMGTFAALVSSVGPSHYLIANIVAKITAAVVGFFLHKHFTFSWQQRDGWARQAILYVFLFVLNIGLSTTLFHACVDLSSLPLLPSKIATDVIIVLTGFVMSRYVVFRAVRHRVGRS